MEQEELKRKLMGLWEKTTHNSKELLGVLFEYYFKEEYIEYREYDGKIVTALCGIPYLFGYGHNKLKGLYIISLSSEEGFRKKGILSEVLQVFNERMKEKFDFTFLVPPTELLADYYGTQGYFSSFFILDERYTPLHDFKNDYLLSLTDSDERIRLLKKDLINQIKVKELDPDNEELREKVQNFLIGIENKGASSVNICHNKRDIDYLMDPDSIRNLNIFVAFDSDDNLSGVAFAQKEEMKRIRIEANYVTDISAYFAMLDKIKRSFPDYSISVNISDPKFQGHSIIQYNYASVNPAGGDLDNSFGSIDLPLNINKLLQPLGMVRLLRYENILQYIAETRSDVDFKLHIRDYKDAACSDCNGGESKKTVYVVKNGKFKEEKFNFEKDRSVLNLTKKEVSELLLRKQDSSNLIMEAFGIPRLNLQLKLLPC